MSIFPSNRSHIDPAEPAKGLSESSPRFSAGPSNCTRLVSRREISLWMRDFAPA